MASSSSFIRNPSRRFFVFISFRGEDTRHNFVSHLFKSLEGKGIDSFKDDAKLEKGASVKPGLFQAIQHSKLSIVVLSENYAFSTWCLDELSKILECRKLVGQIVVPVFYKIDPSDVRHLRGSFAKAFAKHEKRFKHETEKVKKWKKALQKVANISGHNSKGRDESRLIEEITDDILHRILNTRNLNMQSIHSDFVGMDPTMRKINELLELYSNDVLMLGIWGMAGIGKTTIAKVAYEMLFSQFEASCFLHDIKAKFHNEGVIPWQKELLSKTSEISNVSLNTEIGGSQQIQNILSHRKVLIVVDGVDDSKQLKGLVSCDWFGPGSRIIITTQDRHLLLQHKVKHIYEAQKLHDGDALQLFSQHAFNKKQPVSELQDLSMQIVRYCQGLPLALEVLGSLMSSRSKLEWEAQIQELKRCPPGRIQDVLKSSLKALEKHQKELFLDIACSFKGWQKTIVEKILDASPINMSSLFERSLITIVREFDWADDKTVEVIYMHDLLQEMGMEIIREESKKKLENKSRIVDYQDVNNLSTRRMGIDKVRGISLLLDGDKDGLKGIHACQNSFASMGNLIYLNLRAINPPHANSSPEESKVLLCKDSLSLPSRLRCLHWHGCPFSQLSSKCNFKNLVVLEMPYSPIKRLWKGVKSLPNLIIFDVSYCQNLRRIPNLCDAPNLEQFILKNCSNLVEIHWSVGDVNNLKVLNLEGCKKLKNLTWLNGDKASRRTHFLLGALKFNTFSKTSEKTKCLTMLRLNGTSIKELPPTIENMQSLRLLHLRDCPRLESLTSNICKLKSLREVDLGGCSKLSFFPEVSETMPELWALYLTKTGITTLPNSICKLQSLRSLRLGGCSKFAILPESIGTLNCLQYIDLEGTTIKSLPSIEGYYSNSTVFEECNRILQRLRGSLRNSLQRHREILRNHCSRFDSVTNVLQRLSNSESHLDRMLAELEVIFNRLPSTWRPTRFTLGRNIRGNGLLEVLMWSNLFPYQLTWLHFKGGDLYELMKMNGMFQVIGSSNIPFAVGSRIRKLSWEFEENVQRMYQIISDLVDPSAFESWKSEIREKETSNDALYDLREAALEEFIDCVASSPSHYLSSNEGEILYLSN